MKVLKVLSIIIIGIIFCGINSFVNAAPMNVNGIVEGKRVEFINIKNIYLDSEELEVNIQEEFINVEIKYVLINQGPEVDIDFVFPIKLMPYSEDFKEIYLKNITMLDGEQELCYSLETEIINNDQYSEDREAINYYLSSLTFRENERKTVKISYDIKPHMIINKNNINFNPKYSPEEFIFDLSPVVNWGDGKIDKFKLTVNYKDIIETSSDIWINMPEYVIDRDGGIYI